LTKRLRPKSILFSVDIVHRAAEESFKKIIMLKKKTVLAIKKQKSKFAIPMEQMEEIKNRYNGLAAPLINGTYN
jgi:hypothetical protein